MAGLRMHYSPHVERYHRLMDDPGGPGPKLIYDFRYMGEPQGWLCHVQDWDTAEYITSYMMAFESKGVSQ
jgi:hypothetical protein